MQLSSFTLHYLLLFEIIDYNLTTLLVEMLLQLQHLFLVVDLSRVTLLTN